MKVLVIGSGGREHAIAYYIHKSPLRPKVYIARGNPGMTFGTQLDIDETDIYGLASFARKESIDLTIVGPERPLSLGLVNVFRKLDLPIFGPTKEAAQIESSKDFAKDLMKKYQIPTADYQTAATMAEAKLILKTRSYPTVLKYNGLAAGKGVLIAESEKEAYGFLEEVFLQKKFGSGKLIIEDFLIGPEFSLMAFVNGPKVYPLAVAQDHKRAYDNDRGPNTGGMGAYSPVPFISEKDIKYAVRKIMAPTAAALCQEGRKFTGVLYGGLMKTDLGIKVIEFNARFGDPEAEVVLPRMQNDLLKAIIDVMIGKDIKFRWHREIVMGIVMASNGYPGAYQCGFTIGNIPENDVFHMGTALSDNETVNSGGRVLIVLGRGPTYVQAQKEAYKKAAQIKGPLFYRSDIGNQAVNKEIKQRRKEK